MKRIITGQPFLYRKDGYDSTVLEVRMNDKVRGDYLNQAMIFASKTYPYLTYKLVEKNGCFYLSENYASLIARPTDKLRSLGSMATDYHLVDVTFINNIIRVSFHHGLCDGGGIKPFVETLIYYYCKLKYDKKIIVEGIRTIDNPMLDDECKEPFDNNFYEVNEDNVLNVNKDGFRIPECDIKSDSCYRTEIEINEKEFIKYVKDSKGTPAIILAILYSKGIKKVFPNTEKDIVCSMATDYRFATDYPNTLRECTGSSYLPYTDIDFKMEISDLCLKYRNLLKKQKSVDNVRFNLNKQIGLFNKIDQIKTLEDKKEALSFFNDIAPDTYVISYLGQMNFGDCNKYVNSTHLYGSGARGITLNMVASGNTISIDILQSFKPDKYIKELLKNLNEIGISYKTNEIHEFTTGKDKSHITSRHQSERYMNLKEE